MIDRTSAKRYFDVLVDTLIISPVEAFAKSARRRLVQRPRFYFFDTGVLNGLLYNFQVSADRIGNLFEHLFLQTVLSSAKAHDELIRVSVFRTEGGLEVDFIIEKQNQIFAVEVKATKNIGKSDLRGLKSFSDFFGKDHKSMIVYLGEDELNLEGIDVYPFTKALQVLGY